jgi:16S rRNA (cytosine967-C5)-methyltransferase
MADISARAIAAKVLVAVLRDRMYLSTVLSGLKLATLDARTAALVQELCYGTLRFQPRLEFWLARLLQQPLRSRDLDIQALLLLGLYQLVEMRVPPHAALKETVDACRYLHKDWAVKLVNAVLRSFQRKQVELESELATNPEALYAHPEWFIKRVQADWPQDWQAVLAAGNQRPPLTLRTNRRVSTRATLLEEFSAAGIAARPCIFSADGLVLATPLHVENLPDFVAGKFSVQDEAAQLAAELLDVQPGQRVLDACAAPGGKTCHLLEHYADVGEVLALDNDAARTEKLRDNLRRLGLPAKVMTADAATPEVWWDRRPFERILLDAPCSASGVIRRHPDIKARRRPQDIGTATALQARLFAALWPLLARGGKLLYATCSVFREENSNQLRAFLEAHTDARLLQCEVEWGKDAFPGRQILAGQNGMDGFYYACVGKT